MWACRLKDSWCSLPWMLFISLTSHHIRDGVRHGLWVCPFGNTAPISYWLYVTITATLPHLCSVLMYLTGTRDMISTKHGVAIDVWYTVLIVVVCLTFYFFPSKNMALEIFPLALLCIIAIWTLFVLFFPSELSSLFDTNYCSRSGISMNSGCFDCEDCEYFNMYGVDLGWAMIESFLQHF